MDNLDAHVTAHTPSWAQFLKPLRIQLLSEWENGRPTWRLLSPLIFDSALFNLRITVDTGFDTDLASVPRLPGASIAIGLGNKAAVIHDALYRHHLLPRDQCDRVFLEAMEVDDIPMREAMYAAVRMFGEPSYNPDFQGWPD